MAACLIFALAATLLLSGHTVAARASLPPLVLIMMENRSYGQIIGARSAPYETALAAQWMNFSHMYSAEHRSLKDYFDITGGQNPQDSPPYPGYTCLPNQPKLCPNPYTNIVDQVEPLGYTWKGYVESYTTPGACDLNTSEMMPYEARYVPWLYYTDINTSTSRCDNVVGSSELQTDIDDRSLPDFSFITPNAWDNSHVSCFGPIPPCPKGSPNKIAQGDSFLKLWVPQLIAAGAEVIITWDEGSLFDNSGCCTYAAGGHIPTIVVGAGVRRSVVNTKMDTYSIFKGIEYRFFGTDVQLLGNQDIMYCSCTPAAPV